MTSWDEKPIDPVVAGERLMTVSDRNLIDTEVNRNERAPQCGAATIEVAEEG